PLGKRRRGQAGVDDPLAGVHPPDGLGQLRGRGVLEQEPACPGRHRRGEVAGPPERGDDDDLPAEPVFGQPPGDLQPVRPRHLDVQDGHVRLVAVGHGDRLVAAGGLRHHGDVALQFEQGNQRLPDHGLVLGDHDVHGHDGIRSRPGSTSVSAAAAGPVSSTLTRSRNPPRSPAPADKVPPRRAARSARPASPAPLTGPASPASADPPSVPPATPLAGAPATASGPPVPATAGTLSLRGPAPSSDRHAEASAPVSSMTISACLAAACRTMLVAPSRTVQASRASTAGGSEYAPGARAWHSIPAEASIRRGLTS